MKPESSRAHFEIVRLANGAHTLYSSAYGEKMHPGLGPAAEAELLYVRQLKIPERMRAGDGEFVVWDVGLGAAANAIAVLRATRDIPRPLRLVSFDNTAEPLAFALEHADALGYLRGYEEQIKTLLEHRTLTFADGKHDVNWAFHLGDFPSWLERRSPNRREGWSPRFSVSPEDKLKLGLQRADQEIGAPHAILFDAFSPAKNPAMWTLPSFTNLFQRLDSARPCSLTTYSRSTMFRVSLLLAGFFAGRGVATGLKEETTVAANTLELIDAPLDRTWLERVRRSDSAEPLRAAAYSRAGLSTATWEKLQAHPQFRA